MYAAIESTYSAGESETYAQIQLSPSGILQDELQPPQPPSVDSLRSVTHSFGLQGKPFNCLIFLRCITWTVL